jgi:hypothetical protein
MSQSENRNLQHRLAWDLIPWVLNKTASAEEARSVEDHLQHCPDCRAEFAFQRSLAGAMKPDAGTAAPDHRPALQRLWAQIDAQEAAPAPAEPPASAPAAIHSSRLLRNSLTRWLAAAAVVEAAALALLGGELLGHRQAEASSRYVTLSAAAPQPPPATIRAVLAPAMTVDSLQALLAHSGLQIVAGPSEAGVFSLAPSAGENPVATAQALALLRADVNVRFAEPVGAAVGLR